MIEAPTLEDSIETEQAMLGDDWPERYGAFRYENLPPCSQSPAAFLAGLPIDPSRGKALGAFMDALLSHAQMSPIAWIKGRPVRLGS